MTGAVRNACSGYNVWRLIEGAVKELVKSMRLEIRQRSQSLIKLESALSAEMLVLYEYFE